MTTPAGNAAATVADDPEVIPQSAPAEPTPQPAPQDAEQAKPGSEAAPTAPPPKAEKPDAKPVKRSPVDEAIERLATDGVKPKEATAPTDEPTGDEEEDDDHPEGKAAEDRQEQAAKVKDDPIFGDWTVGELKKTKGSVKERFRELHKQVAEHKPYVELGRDWETFVEQAGLDEDLQILDQKQMAWAMKSQAAILRAVEAVAAGHQPHANDLALLGDIRKGIGMVDERLGIAPTTADPTSVLAELQKFSGEIPSELKEMAETYGLLDKDEVALLAAIRAMKAGSWKPGTAKPAAPTLKPAPEPAPKEERPAPRATTTSVPLYREQLNRKLDAIGVDAPQRAAWVQTNLVPAINQILKEAYPDQPAKQVYTSLTPREQHDLHIEALERLQSDKRALPPPKPRAPTHKPLTHQGTAGASAQAGSPLAAVIERLAIPGT